MNRHRFLSPANHYLIPTLSLNKLLLPCVSCDRIDRAVLGLLKNNCRRVRASVYSARWNCIWNSEESTSVRMRVSMRVIVIARMRTAMHVYVCMSACYCEYECESYE